MSAITRVWIDVDCICCQACVNALPEVFALPDDRAMVVGAVRMDGLTSANDTEFSALNGNGVALSEQIREAASGCPVDIIKFE
ncbi:MAG: ferredoxin [Planctomycetes bacterium]|nr:ferredoxin [Planctomycetota bacterium]